MLITAVLICADYPYRRCLFATDWIFLIPIDFGEGNQEDANFRVTAPLYTQYFNKVVPAQAVGAHFLCPQQCSIFNNPSPYL